jgi:biotin operon repressor
MPQYERQGRGDKVTNSKIYSSSKRDANEPEIMDNQNLLDMLPATSQELADKLRITPNAVRHRMEHLRKDGLVITITNQNGGWRYERKAEQ